MTKIWRGIIAWLFPRPQHPLRWAVIEREKGVLIGDRGDEDAIASLRDHPGMKALLNRMSLQRAALTAALTKQRHKSIRDVDYLQSGLYWLGFLESQVSTAVGRTQAKPTYAVAESEILEFERVRNSIESVGITSPAN